MIYLLPLLIVAIPAVVVLIGLVLQYELDRWYDGGDK